MAKLKIREATLRDLKKIQALDCILSETEHKFEKSVRPNWAFTKPAEQYFRNRIRREKGTIFLATINNAIAGYITGDIISKGSYRQDVKLGEIESLFVLDQYRDHKVGRALVNKFIAWCKEKKANKVRVTSYAKNRKAIKFYLRNNFRKYTIVLEKDLI